MTPNQPGPQRVDTDSSRPVSRWVWVVGITATVAVTVLFFVIRHGPESASAPAIPTAGVTAPSAQPSSAHASPSSRKQSSKPKHTSSGSTLPELAAVSLDSQSERSDGVVVQLTKIESVTGASVLPGEVAGPALRISVLITNGSSASLNLADVVVNGYRGVNRVPLETLTSPGGSPFAGSLAEGVSATGVYLFRVESQDRADVTFTVDVKAGTAASVFRGDAR